MTDYEDNNNTILEIPSEISDKFPDNTEAFVKEFVAVGEAGEAIKTLCVQAFEYGIKLSAPNRDGLRCIAKSMNMNMEELPG